MSRFIHIQTKIERENSIGMDVVARFFERDRTVPGKVFAKITEAGPKRLNIGLDLDLTVEQSKVSMSPRSKKSRSR